MVMVSTSSASTHIREFLQGLTKRWRNGEGNIGCAAEMNLLYGMVLSPLIENLQREVIVHVSPIILGLTASTIFAAILADTKMKGANTCGMMAAGAVFRWF